MNTKQEVVMAQTLEDALVQIAALETKIKELEELTLDDLTGLPRRKVYQAAVEGEILRCKRSGKSFSILVIDMNYLKTVNDTHGHLAGDQMIVSFAKLLKKSLRDCDIVARTGGDEFMVFLPDQNEEHARTVKKHLLEAFERSKGLALPFFMGAAIGVATFGKKHSSFEKMYIAADKAMYEHKKWQKADLKST